MLFWSLKLVFLLHSLKFTQRERKKEKKEAMILLQSHSRFLLQTLLNRVHKFVPFLSSSSSSSSSSLFYSCFEIHSYIYVYIFWFDCAVLIKQWNWITTGSSLTMFVSTFRSFSPSSFFFCCIDFHYSMKLYLESICFINFHNLFEFLIE